MKLTWLFFRLGGLVKGCVWYIFARLFCKSKRALEKHRKMFWFHSESSLRYWNNQILAFQLFKCHDVIKFLSMKNESRFTEYLGRSTHSGHEIWSIFVISQKKNFCPKIIWKTWPGNLVPGPFSFSKNPL